MVSYEAIQALGLFSLIWRALIVVMERVLRTLTIHLDLLEGSRSVHGNQRAHCTLRKIVDRRFHHGYCHSQKGRVSHLTGVLEVFSLHVWPILPLPCRWRHKRRWNTHSYLTSEDGRAIFPRSICSFCSRKPCIPCAKMYLFLSKIQNNLVDLNFPSENIDFWFMSNSHQIRLCTSFLSLWRVSHSSSLIWYQD